MSEDWIAIGTLGTDNSGVTGEGSVQLGDAFGGYTVSLKALQSHVAWRNETLGRYFFRDEVTEQDVRKWVSEYLPLLAKAPSGERPEPSGPVLRASVNSGNPLATTSLNLVPSDPGGPFGRLESIKAETTADVLGFALAWVMPEVRFGLPAGAAKTTAVGELRAQGLKDAHHVIQDAAVRDIPGYNTSMARGVQLPGPATQAGTPHSLATAVQRQAGGGTYAAERRIAYKALRRARIPVDDARTMIGEADLYFQRLGVTPSTLTRIPGNR